MKKYSIPFILNICLFALETAAFIWMAKVGAGTSFNTAVYSLRYFTVDSNVFMALAALVAAIEQGLVLLGKKKDVSKFTYVLKLSATASVTLTLLATFFYLTPANGPYYGWFSLYKRYNLILHFLAPVLSLIVFIPYEQSGKINFYHTFTASLPSLAYCVYYVTTTLLHTHNGQIDPGYDWYAFFIFGQKSVFFLVPAFLLCSYVITYKMWKYNGGKKIDGQRATL